HRSDAYPPPCPSLRPPVAPQGGSDLARERAAHAAELLQLPRSPQVAQPPQRGQRLPPAPRLRTQLPPDEEEHLRRHAPPLGLRDRPELLQELRLDPQRHHPGRGHVFV